MREKSTAANEEYFLRFLPQHGAISLWCVERVKRFVNVHLHCIISKLKRIRKMSSLPPSGKVSAGAHGCLKI